MAKPKPPKIEVLPEEAPPNSPSLDREYANVVARVKGMGPLDKLKYATKVTDSDFPFEDVGRFIDNPAQPLDAAHVSAVVELFDQLAGKYGLPWADALDLSQGKFNEGLLLSWVDKVPDEVQKGELLFVGMACKRLFAAPPDRADRNTFVQYLEGKTGVTARAALKAEVTGAKAPIAPGKKAPKEIAKAPKNTPEQEREKLAKKVWDAAKKNPVRAALVATGMVLAAIFGASLGGVLGKKDESMGQSAMVSVGGTLAQLMGFKVTEQELQAFVGNFRDAKTRVGEAVEGLRKDPTNPGALAKLTDVVFTESTRRDALKRVGDMVYLPLQDYADLSIADFVDRAKKLPHALAARAQQLAETVQTDAAQKGGAPFDRTRSVGDTLRDLYTDPKGFFNPSTLLRELGASSPEAPAQAVG